MAVQAILDTIKHKLSRLSIGTCDEAPDEELPETIRAHATITTMLSLVKRTRMAFSTTNVKFTDKRRRQELKVLNALATVLDRDVEVVAVVGKSDDGSGELKVIVSAHLVRDMERRPTAQPGSFGGRILNLFSNGNPRRSGPMGSLLSTSDPPAIVNPCAPRLNSMISGGWSNRSIAAGASHLVYSQGVSFESLDTHVWIVNTLLNEIKSGDEGYGASLLQRYVIASGFRRILHRLNHPTLSKPFSDSLKKVSTIEFPELSEMAPEPGKLPNDKRFLLTLKHLSPYLRVGVKNLLQQAEAASDNKPYNVYTKDTCIEFHHLLCELLETFQASLNGLKDSSGDSSSGDSSSGDSSSGDSSSGDLDFQQYLYRALFFGEALHRLARSDAITRHLQAIGPLLADPRRYKVLYKVRDVTVEMMAEEEEQGDTELASVQPDAIHEGRIVQPLWASYLDWLMLVVDYFDGVVILGDHITGPYFPHSKLCIKILITPPASDRMLPWRNLLESKHFPNIPAQNSPSLPYMSTSVLVDCLDEWSRSDRKASDGATNIHRVGKLLGLELRRQPLLLGIGFDGSQHCEIQLASFIYLSRIFTSGPTSEKYKHILDELQNAGTVIGLSKRCCPLCQCLLDLLTFNEAPFLIRGSHSAITACALPAWLPEKIVRQMNRIFGVQLRRELIKLLNQPTGSKRLSLDSREQDSRTEIHVDRGVNLNIAFGLK